MQAEVPKTRLDKEADADEESDTEMRHGEPNFDVEEEGDVRYPKKQRIEHIENGCKR